MTCHRRRRNSSSRDLDTALDCDRESVALTWHRPVSRSGQEEESLKGFVRQHKYVVIYSPAVKHTDRVDDARSVRSLSKSVEQEICPQKRSEVIDLKSHLVAVGSCLAGEEQTPRVVGQNIDPRIAGEQFFGQASHVVQAAEIHEVGLGADFGGDGGSPLRRSANHGHRSPQLPEAPGCGGADS
jgi:hypothetical protein